VRVESEVGCKWGKTEMGVEWGADGVGCVIP